MTAWLRRLWRHEDELIDALIAERAEAMKRRQFFAGMDRPDWSRINAIGAAKWRESVDARGRIVRQERPALRRVR